MLINDVVNFEQLGPVIGYLPDIGFNFREQKKQREKETSLKNCHMISRKKLMETTTMYNSLQNNARY